MRRQNAAMRLSAHLLFVIGSLAKPAAAGADISPSVTRILVDNRGPGPASDRAVRAATGLVPGAALSPGTLSSVSNRLMATGLFKGVSVNTRSFGKHGSELVVSVYPHYVLDDVVFVGLNAMSARKARSCVELAAVRLWWSDMRASPAVVEEASSRLLEAYRSLHYYDTTIQCAIEPKGREGRARLVVTVVEDPAISELKVAAGNEDGVVRGIRFRNEGPGPLDVREAKKMLAIRDGELVTRAIVDREVERLRGAGWFAEVSARIESVASGVVVVFAVCPYPMLDGIEFGGDVATDDWRARRATGLTSFGLLRRAVRLTPEVSESAAAALRGVYRSLRYYAADISCDVVPSSKAGCAKLRLFVRAGARSSMRWPEPVSVAATGGVPAEVLVRVDFRNEGAGSVDWSKARSVVRVPPGTVATPAVLQKLVGNLEETGWFDEVSVVTRRVKGGVEALFTVKARPVLDKVRFEGLSAMSRIQAAHQTGLSFFNMVTYNRRVSASQVEESIAGLRRAYAALNYDDVDVRWRREPSRRAGHESLVFAIKEGARREDAGEIPLLADELGTLGTLARIRFRTVGPNTVSERSMREQLKLRTGLALKREEVDDAVRDLTGTGWFESVKVFTAETRFGVVLVFEVHPRAKLDTVGFEGVRAMSARTAAGHAGLSGSWIFASAPILSPELAEGAAQRIKDAYRKFHYYEPEVTWRTEPTRRAGRERLVFVVKEGPLGVVRKEGTPGKYQTEFFGRVMNVRVNNLGPGELDERDALQTAGIERDTELTRALLQESVDRMEASGVYESVRAQTVKGQEGLELVYDISPHPFLDGVLFEGLAVFSEKKARSHAGLGSRTWFGRKVRVTPERCAKAVAQLTDAYRRARYYDADVKWRVVASPRDGHASVVISVKEGGSEIVRNEKPVLAGTRAERLGTLAEIRFKNLGPGPLDRRAASKAVQLRKRSLLTRGDVQDAVEQLLSTGLFEDVEVGTLEAAAGLDLVFSISPRPLLGKVAFEGLQAMTVRQATHVVNLTAGKYIGRDVGNQAARQLMEAYRAMYYYTPVVNWRAAPADKTGYANLVFTVTEGPHGVVDAVRFSGNKELSSNDLRDKVAVKPVAGLWSRLLGRDVFLMESLEEDRQSILQAYHERGCVRAQVGVPIIRAAGPERILIDWPILNEGPAYSVSSVGFEGNAPFSEAELTGAIRLGAGDALDPERISKVAEFLRNLYAERGHPFAAVKSKIDFDDTNAVAGVVFQIAAGPRCKIGEVRINGNTMTSDKVIRQEIGQKAGDVYRESVVAEAKRGLLTTGMFSDAKVFAAAAKDQAVCDLEVEVKERNTGKVQVGVSYGTDEGTALVMELQENNFSFVPPFRGDGMRVALSGKGGEKKKNAMLDWTQPRLGYTPFLLNARGSYEDDNYSSASYSQRSYGGDVGIGLPMGEDTLLTLGYQITQFDVYDVADDAPNLIMEESGKSRLGAVQGRCLYDSRDRRFRPSQGFMAAVETFAGTKALGGDIEAWGVEAKVSWLYSPWANHVLNVRGGVSVVESLGCTNRVPLVLRRFLGGSDNLRGFEYRSVAPMDEDGNVLGGQTAWWSTIEYMVPVPFVDWLDMSAYYDVGDVSSDAFSFSGVGPMSDWGVGLSIRAQNFPIRIDLAVPVDVMEGDPANRSGSARLSFAAGYFF